MKIGFAFFGITYGGGGRGSDRDFRHCWPNIRRMLIDPYVERGHEAKVGFSTYPFTDPELYNQFFELVKPDRVEFSNLEGSTSFTSKLAALDMFDDKDVDVIILTRSDIHFSKVMADENIEYFKFNFLFPEEGWWTSHLFTCDNFYVFPAKMAPFVKQAMLETFNVDRPGEWDTHGLLTRLIKYVIPNYVNFISQAHELSDVNSFYTCCRALIPTYADRAKHMHPEVRERFYNEAIC